MSHADLAALVDAVEQASREGRVLAVADVWEADEGELLALLESTEISWIREGSGCYLYSTVLMTREYAGTAARIAAGDPVHVIAATVRYDSETYPRPTPLAAFETEPYRLPAEQVQAAFGALSSDPAFADIRMVHASDGAAFLYSARHLDEGTAMSLAERMSVGRYENP